jgi:hypothetical protein
VARCRAMIAAALVAGCVADESAAQNSKSAMDEVIDFASRAQPVYTADFRAKFAHTLANYCQEVLKALPTNTPAEDAWVTAEEKSGNGAKIQRLINSKEYSRSALKNTFTECKDTTALLIQIQQLPNKTATDSRLEAGQFIQLALNFNTFLEPFSSKVELNKDVKFALGDLHLHVVRTGLLRAAWEALQDVHQ